MAARRCGQDADIFYRFSTQNLDDNLVNLDLFILLLIELN